MSIMKSNFLRDLYATLPKLLTSYNRILTIHKHEELSSSSSSNFLRTPDSFNNSICFQHIFPEILGNILVDIEWDFYQRLHMIYLFTITILDS